MWGLVNIVDHEKVQYNATLGITGGIRRTSRECIYNELGLESLADRRWYRKMTFFCKIVKNLAPKYLQSYLLPQALNQYSARLAKKIYSQLYPQEHYHLATCFLIFDFFYNCNIISA